MTSLARRRTLLLSRIGRAIGRATHAPLGVVSRHSGGGLCLTFDDGPHPEWTPRILDVLAAHDVRATFFVIGAHAERHPTILRRMLDEGHAVGCHTYRHDSIAWAGPTAFLRDLERTSGAISPCGGHSRLFRPPRGHMAPWNIVALRAAGVPVVLWSFDSRDYACGSTAELRRSLDAWVPGGGDILLFHDDSRATAEALDGFILRIREAGLTFSRCAPGARRAEAA
jgi:peptidoglycan-N-acetylglucosamine deacetylase